MKKKDQPEPSRPLCMCGSPGAFQIQIDVQELVLERDAGIASRPYWTAKFRSGTKIETIMCQQCLRANVQLQVVATAKVEKDHKAP